MIVGDTTAARWRFAVDGSGRLDLACSAARCRPTGRGERGPGAGRVVRCCRCPAPGRLSHGRWPDPAAGGQRRRAGSRRRLGTRRSTRRSGFTCWGRSMFRLRAPWTRLGSRRRPNWWSPSPCNPTACMTACPGLPMAAGGWRHGGSGRHLRRPAVAPGPGRMALPACRSGHRLATGRGAHRLGRAPGARGEGSRPDRARDPGRGLRRGARRAVPRSGPQPVSLAGLRASRPREPSAGDDGRAAFGRIAGAGTDRRRWRF